MRRAIVPAKPAALSTDMAPSVEGAARLAVESLSPNTRRAYARAWAAFVAWCKDRHLVSLPADPRSVALYVADCVEGRAGKHRPQSVEVYLAAVRFAHVGRGHPSPCDHPAVHAVMRGARRTYGTRPDKKTPAVVDVVRKMMHASRTEDASPYVATRDRAMVLLGFAAALRRSELVALDWSDIEARDGGLLVTVRFSKTDKAGKGRTVHVHAGADAAVDPVAWLAAWNATLAELARVRAPRGAVFVSLSPNAWLKRLAPANVARVVKRLVEAAGLDPKRFAGHSLRSGFATSAARAGKSLDRIRAHTRHASLDMLKEYLSDDVPWDDDAGKGLL